MRTIPKVSIGFFRRRAVRWRGFHCGGILSPDFRDRIHESPAAADSTSQHACSCRHCPKNRSDHFVERVSRPVAPLRQVERVSRPASFGCPILNNIHVISFVHWPIVRLVAAGLSATGRVARATRRRGGRERTNPVRLAQATTVCGSQTCLHGQNASRHPTERVGKRPAPPRSSTLDRLQLAARPPPGGRLARNIHTFFETRRK